MNPLEYAALGYPVFPLHHILPDGHCSCGKDCPPKRRGKHPRLKNGLKDATIDRLQIAQWWQRWPDAQIGIVIPDGALVLDVDDLDLIQVVLDGRWPWDGPIAKTPSGGMHFFCRDPRPDGRRTNSTWQLPKGIDVRAGGRGYVVAPGPNSRDRKWDRAIIRAADLPPCPIWISDLLQPAVPAVRPPPAAVQAPPSAYLQAALDAEHAAVRDAPVGRGNHQLNASAFNLGQLEAHGLYLQTASDTLFAALATWAEPMAQATALKTFDSGWRSGTANPRQIPERKASAPTYSAKSMSDWNDKTPERKAPPSKFEGGSSNRHQGSPSNLPPPEEPVKPEIAITTDEPTVNDKAITALANDARLYTRNQRLVTIIHSTAKFRRPKPDAKKSELSYPRGTPLIHDIPPATLRERMAGAATWAGFDARSQEMVPKHPPTWSVNAVHARGQWPELRTLRAIVDYPICRPDGTICSERGYDDDTGFFIGDVPPILLDAHPTQDSAEIAGQILLDLIRDFPAKDDETKSAWLALLLTTIARPAIDGPTPLFVIDANTRGTGKTLMTDLVGLILVGKVLPAFGHTTNQEELEKILISIARLGLPIVNLDNVVGSLGGGVLDRWLTSTAPAGRTLGASEVQTYDWTTVLAASANNANLHGDTDRRTIFGVLESPLENPELRDPSTFRYPDIAGHIRRYRERYLRAACTILRAHALAGRPTCGGRPKGSFESWCSVVRDAVMFAGLADCERQPDDPVRPEDADTSTLGALLPALQDSFGDKPFLVRHALLKAWPEDRYDEPDLPLQDALSGLAYKGDRPSAQGLGKLFGRLAKRWSNGLSLAKTVDGHTKQKRWRVVSKDQTKGKANGQ